jgi:hypothetical protein
MPAAALCAVGAFTPSASATSYYSKTFYWNDTTFISTDNIGKFSAQITYVVTGSSENPIAFGLQIAAPIQAIATGPMTCSASQWANGSPTGATDYHPGVPVSYFWHWTVPYNDFPPTYDEYANCYFPVKGGQANVGAVLTYDVNDSTAALVRTHAAVLSSEVMTLTITPDGK